VLLREWLRAANLENLVGRIPRTLRRIQDLSGSAGFAPELGPPAWPAKKELTRDV